MFAGVRQKGHMPGASHCCCRPALYLGRGPSFTARANATALVNEITQGVKILPVNFFKFDGTNFAPTLKEASAPAAWAAAPTFIAGLITTTTAITLAASSPTRTAEGFSGCRAGRLAGVF
jgi:hypothetical protein